MDGVDNEEKFTDCLKSLRDKLRAKTLVVQFPIGAGKELKGIVDVVKQKAYYFQLGDQAENYHAEEIPTNLIARTQQYRQELIEKLVEGEMERISQDCAKKIKKINEEADQKIKEAKSISENSPEKLLDQIEKKRAEAEVQARKEEEENLISALEKNEKKEELTVAEVKKMLRQATLTGRYFPVFCGSAYKHVGVKLLLDGVVDYLPSPLDIEEIPVFSPRDKSQRGVVNCKSPLPCLALAFKIVFDDYNNKLTFFRVYAGKISANSYIYNVSRDKKERVSRLVRMHANKKEDVKEVGAGDIAVAIGLDHAITGDSFGEEKNPLLLEAINFAEPVISQAIEPKTNEDKDKLKGALDKLKIQDPGFKY
ncbi:12460_t:CDS:1 [Cetraspora pellucida]|uniref:12455_t:CDS:1 n=2 Tax=Cetraspora pellucida TaxID=1433469 RepID=A0ACA9MDU7_9GLOM|nr:12455_t:CDS:1 [Cetraspora pellucida]CAG8581234.1 12460_t:CDS:1 [Cetraspora pellucida]